MEEVRNGLISFFFWVGGDEAYQVSERIVVPYPSLTLSEDVDNFNFNLSSLRMRIEQALGILVARWRMLRDGLKFSVRRCSTVIAGTLKLHNFCLQQDRHGSEFPWMGCS